MNTLELFAKVTGEINQLHAEIIDSAKSSLDKAIRIGELLTQAKGRLKHGQWLPWIKVNLPFERWTAAQYIRCYERRDELKCVTITQLADAYRFLAEPSGDEETEQPQLTLSVKAETEAPTPTGNHRKRFDPEPETEATTEPVQEAGDQPTQEAAAPAPEDKPSRPHVTNNSGENEWYTPAIYIEAARKVMGGIDIDPASSKFANTIVKAEMFFDIETDGLAYDWPGRVWLNPPYAQDLVAQFTGRLVNDYAQEITTQACVLVNNATETAWFQHMIRAVDAICFIKGRIKFLGADGLPANTPLQGQAMLYFGNRIRQFADTMQQFGFIMAPV